ncbi:MAG: Fic/DOC family protein [Clostridia bacterium]
MFSKYEVYTTVQSIYCYKDVNILKNKLHIKDPDILRSAEEEITLVKQMELLQNPIRGNFTKTHLMNIHKFIFGDIYTFAGKIRREQIAKADTMFYPPNLINRELDRVFAKIKSDRMLKEKSFDKVFENLAYTMAELNIIHPFREGNGRTIREFIRLMAKKFGYNLNWGNVDRERLLDTSVRSVYDYTALIEMLKDCIEY